MKINYTENHKDFTVNLRKVETGLLFSLENNVKTVDKMLFRYGQNALFEMICEYFDSGLYADIFEQLTVYGINGLFEILFYMNEKNITL